MLKFRGKGKREEEKVVKKKATAIAAGWAKGGF